MDIHIINISCLCPSVLLCSEPIAIFLSLSLWHPTTRLNSSPDVTKLWPLGPLDRVVKKAEQHFIMDRLIPILATPVSTCFDLDGLQSRVTPSSLVTSTCSNSTLFITRFSRGLVNDLSQI